MVSRQPLLLPLERSLVGGVKMIAPLITSRTQFLRRTAALGWIDRALACLLFLVLIPALALAGAWIWFLSGRRSPLVAHLRVGTQRRPFWMIKFRTMWPRSQPLKPQERGSVERVVSDEVLEIKPRIDPRVTSRFAAWCRMYSIDELPQLWHVVRGEMSLVGPRPLTARELDKYYGEQATEILDVPPGLTGLWQILGRNNLNYPQRRRLDLFLVRHYCLGLYVKILLRTVPRVLSGSGAW